MLDKSDLRRDLLKRRAMAHAAVPDAALRLIDYFPCGVEVAHQSVIAAYMPLPNEIDPLPLLQGLIAKGGLGALPRISPITTGEEGLYFHLVDIDDPTQFETNKWGVSEPVADLPQARPNILLVPLLGFDDKGHRLGYGKGFYDKAIARLKAHGPLTTIGLAYSAQQVAQIPTEPHDERLDWIVTENGAYNIPL